MSAERRNEGRQLTIGHLATSAAMDLAASIIGIFAPCLREEEQRAAFDEVYDACKAALVRYTEQLERANSRLGRS